jgi:hypothetical protein
LDNFCYTVATVWMGQEYYFPSYESEIGSGWYCQSCFSILNSVSTLCFVENIIALLHKDFHFYSGSWKSFIFPLGFQLLRHILLTLSTVILILDLPFLHPHLRMHMLFQSVQFSCVYLWELSVFCLKHPIKRTTYWDSNDVISMLWTWRRQKQLNPEGKEQIFTDL